jgi:hypothetical protein
VGNSSVSFTGASLIAMRPNVRVDAAARFHSTFAGLIMMRNTPPPLASNGLLRWIAHDD